MFFFWGGVAGTFEKFGDMKPKVMMVDFEPLNESDREVRAKELADTGIVSHPHHSHPR